MSTVKERILQFIEYKGISNRNFCQKINVSPNILSTKSALGTDILIKINIEYPELNMDWVIAGRGEMRLESFKDYALKDLTTLLQEDQEKYIRKIVQEELEKKNKRKSNDVASAGN